MQSNPSPTPLLLRKLTIIAFPPGFLLALIHGIISHNAFPAVGIIPLSGSAVLGLALLYRNTISYGGSPISLSPTNILALDFSLMVLYIIFSIYSWVTVPNGWDGGQVMLGTYGTVPLMLNCGIHVYFVLRDLERVVKHTRDCPECRDGTHRHGSGRDGYASLGEGVVPYQDMEEGREGVEEA